MSRIRDLTPVDVHKDPSGSRTAQESKSRFTATDPAPVAFQVDGERFVTAGDAARLLLADVDLSPSGAYAAVKRGADAGTVRSVAVNARHRLYHHGDVLELAANLRGT